MARVPGHISAPRSYGRGFIQLTPMLYLAAAALAAIVMLGVAFSVQTSRLKATKAEFSAFVATTKLAGEQAKKEAQKQTAADKRNKERSDAENKRTTDALRDATKRLRDARAVGSYVPPAPAGAVRPDLACFDRAELERAIRGFDAGIQGLVDEGSQATLDLNTARQWAQP